MVVDLSGEESISTKKLLDNYFSLKVSAIAQHNMRLQKHKMNEDGAVRMKLCFVLMISDATTVKQALNCVFITA
ncbi:MAG: hypothetical protein NT163_12770 [Chlorobiales bacterium]|nr:hypothetical protein [Chlorobiales bacterium]